MFQKNDYKERCKLACGGEIASIMQGEKEMNNPKPIIVKPLDTKITIKKINEKEETIETTGWVTTITGDIEYADLTESRTSDWEIGQGDSCKWVEPYPEPGEMYELFYYPGTVTWQKLTNDRRGKWCEKEQWFMPGIKNIKDAGVEANKIYDGVMDSSNRDLFFTEYYEHLNKQSDIFWDRWEVK